MTPAIKQFLSALLVAIVGAALLFLAQYSLHFPPAVQIIAASVLLGLVHRVPALGSFEATLQKVFGATVASNVITSIDTGIASPAQVVAASVKPKPVQDTADTSGAA